METNQVINITAFIYIYIDIKNLLKKKLFHLSHFASSAERKIERRSNSESNQAIICCQLISTVVFTTQSRTETT